MSVPHRTGHRHGLKKYLTSVISDQTVFEFHPDAVYALDFDRRLMDANKLSDRLVGYGFGEIFGLDFTHLRQKSPAS